MSKQLPPAPTAREVGPCPSVIQTVGRPGNGSLPSTIASPDHSNQFKIDRNIVTYDLARKDNITKMKISLTVIKS